MNKYNIIDAWSVAHENGHGAFRLLKLGSEDEKILKDIDNWFAEVSQNDPRWGREEYHQKIYHKKITLKNMYYMYSSSVFLFQTMMEAIVNDTIDKIINKNYKSKLDAQLATNLLSIALELQKGYFIDEKGKKMKATFAIKWKRLLLALGQSDAEFDMYKENIYQGLRNVFIHPVKENLYKLDSLHFLTLYEGYKNGWKAYELLYLGLGHAHDDNSWEIMCNVHGLDLDIKYESCN